MYNFSLMKIGFAKLRKEGIMRKQKSAILRKIMFANDCAKWYFSCKNVAQAKICASFRKNCVKVVLRMEILSASGGSHLQTPLNYRTSKMFAFSISLVYEKMHHSNMYLHYAKRVLL